MSCLNLDRIRLRMPATILSQNAEFDATLTRSLWRTQSSPVLQSADALTQPVYGSRV